MFTVDVKQQYKSINIPNQTRCHNVPKSSMMPNAKIGGYIKIHISKLFYVHMTRNTPGLRARVGRP